jgi:HEAT repeat protein
MMDAKLARKVFEAGLIPVALALAMILCGCGGSADTPANPANANTTGTGSSQSDPSVTEVKSTSPEVVAKKVEETKPVEPMPLPEVSDKDPLLTNPALLKTAVKGYMTKSGASYQVDSEIADKLEALGPEGIDAIISLLEDESLDVRRGAAHYLIRMFDARRPEMVAGFQKLLADSDRSLHAIALQAAVKMKPADQKTSVLPLAQIVASTTESETNRKASLAILRDLGEDAREASDVVVQVATSDAAPSMRGAAMNAVPKIGDTETVVETLRKGLTDNEKSVQTVALAKLWAMEKDAAPAAKEIATFFANDDKNLREKAIETLVRIGADSVPALITQLSDKTPRVREHALYTLGKMGSTARPALPQIEGCLKDEDKRVRELAKVVAERINKGP